METPEHTLHGLPTQMLGSGGLKKPQFYSFVQRNEFSLPRKMFWTPGGGIMSKIPNKIPLGEMTIFNNEQLSKHYQDPTRGIGGTEGKGVIIEFLLLPLVLGRGLSSLSSTKSTGFRHRLLKVLQGLKASHKWACPGLQGWACSGQAGWWCPCCMATNSPQFS